MSDEMKSIFQGLNARGKMILPEAATEEQIAAFEKEHAVELPKEYKEWLLCTDGGELFLPGGIQFYGVAHKPIIDVDYNDRPGSDYTVIGALAMGDPILCEKSTSQISIYNHEAGTIEPDEIYPDFLAFLQDIESILGIGG